MFLARIQHFGCVFFFARNFNDVRNFVSFSSFYNHSESSFRQHYTNYLEYFTWQNGINQVFEQIVKFSHSFIRNSKVFDIFTVFFEVVLFNSGDVVFEIFLPIDVLHVKIELTVFELKFLCFIWQSLYISVAKFPFTKAKVGHHKQNFLCFLVSSSVHHLFSENGTVQVHQNRRNLVVNEVENLKRNFPRHDKIRVIPETNFKSINFGDFLKMYLTKSIFPKDFQIRAAPSSCNHPKSNYFHGKYSCKSEFQSKVESDPETFRKNRKK